MAAKVLAFGTFDGLHPGHRHYLDSAAAYGDLIVLVARDATVLKVKGRRPKHDEETRLAELKSAGYNAVLGSTTDRYAVLDEVRPDVICLGYDQTHFTEDLAKESEKRGLNAKIVRLDAFQPDVYKSSLLNR